MRIKQRTPEDRLKAQIEYHRTGAEFYRSHRQKMLADWSDQEVARLSEKLPKQETGEPQDRWE